MTETDVLWGGTLTSVGLDPTTWTLSAEVVLTSGDDTRRYTLTLNDVRSMRADRADLLPWDYAELTEVHVSPVADGVMVELILWNDDTGLSITGSRLSVAPSD